jgi:hypothetical protein
MLKWNQHARISKTLILVGSLASGQQAWAMTIDARFGAGVTAAEQAAFNTVAQMYDSLITNSITVTINVETDANTSLGGSSTALVGLNTGNSADYIAVAKALNSHYGSNIINTAVASQISDYTYLSMAEARALGLTTGPNVSLDSNGLYVKPDGTFYFNPNQTYTTDPNNQAVAGAYDFLGVAEHEISEILGRTSGLTQSTPFYTAFDLMRYTALGQENYSAGSNVYFSLDNGATALQYFNSGASGSDPQDWSGSNPNDAFNAYANPGIATGITSVDITALKALGYNVSQVPLPSSVWLFVSALAVGFRGLRNKVRD